VTVDWHTENMTIAEARARRRAPFSFLLLHLLVSRATPQSTEHNMVIDHPRCARTTRAI